MARLFSPPPIHNYRITFYLAQTVGWECPTVSKEHECNLMPMANEQDTSREREVGMGTGARE